jgi:hypothetical protein
MPKKVSLLAAFVTALSLALVVPAPAGAGEKKSSGSNAITLTRWTSDADFARGTSEGVAVADGTLSLSATGLETTRYTDPFGGDERLYDVGTWTSPVVELDYDVDQAISSWNAVTPTGTWVETLFRARYADGTESKWYVLGRWTSGMDYAAGDIHRTSLNGQGDTDGTVLTDTYASRKKRKPVAFQTQVRLLRPAGASSTPRLDAVTTMTSAAYPDHHKTTSAFTLGGAKELKVPPYPQNIHSGEYSEYGGGGEVWCSPTSSAMVMKYFGASPSADELADIPYADPEVDYAAMHVWDYAYDGAGNWPFNAAYAHTYGLDSFVTRLRSLAEVERFVDAGIPVIASVSWKLSDMPEAGYATNGHLLVIIGFTDEGDPIINDPAANSHENVLSVYTRENFEKVWQESTGGVVYIYHPKGTPLPANLPGVTPNW